MLVLAGCGRLAFEVEDTRDASGAAHVDSAIDTVGVGPFGAPTPIDELNAGARYSDDPSLTADELAITFTTSRPGSDSCDVWTAQRATTSAAWDPPAPVAGGVDGASCQATAFLARDGLTLWFADNRSGNGDIYVATRAAREDPFGTAVEIAEVSSAFDDYGPTVTRDGLMMFFESNRRGTWDVFVTTRATALSAWSAPALVRELATQASERSPQISADGLTLWFISDRESNQDIYVSTRASLDAAFAPAVRVEELSSAAAEDDPWLAEDGHHIYFARYDSAGDGRLYVAER